MKHLIYLIIYKLLFVKLKKKYFGKYQITKHLFQQIIKVFLNKLRKSLQYKKINLDLVYWMKKLGSKLKPKKVELQILFL
jgi:hypothetical protein